MGRRKEIFVEDIFNLWDDQKPYKPVRQAFCHSEQCLRGWTPKLIENTKSDTCPECGDYLVWTVKNRE